MNTYLVMLDKHPDVFLTLAIVIIVAVTYVVTAGINAGRDILKSFFNRNRPFYEEEDDH